MEGVIYELAFPNGKRYVGQTRHFKRRMTEHARGNKSEDGHLVKRAIAKYGWLNVRVILLESDIPVVELNLREIMWIRERQSLVGQQGYNLSPGGGAQVMDVPEVQVWHQKQMKDAMNRDDVRAKKRALWKSCLLYTSPSPRD